MTSVAAQQFLDIHIQDDLKYDIRIENAQVDGGEFYNNGDPNDVITADEIGDMSIRHNGGRRHICSSGNSGSMSGPQGMIDLVDDVTDAKICTLAWDAFMEPGKPNTFTMRDNDERYKVEIGKWNKFGTMGEVPVTVSDM